MSGKKISVTKNLNRVFENYAGIGQELQFLNAVFSFLNKKTTYLAKPGVSKQVLQIVHNHIDIAKKREIRDQKLNKKKVKKTTTNTSTENTNTNTTKSADVISTETGAETTPTPTSSATTDTNAKMEIDTQTEAEAGTETATTATTATATATTASEDHGGWTKVEDDDNKAKDGGKSIDIHERIEIDENTVAPSGNGGDTGKYVWTQTLSSVEVIIAIDSKLRGKQLNIQIKKNSLFVCVRGNESEPIMDGDLHGPIDINDSSWMLDQEYGKDTKTLTLTLQKMSGMNWWSRVVVGDPEIDTKLIQPENSKLQDLDTDTRSTVEQMMFDQRQKMKGLPTSKDLKQNAILEKFKAQHPEMDFSNVNMSGGGGFGGGFPGM